MRLVVVLVITAAAFFGTAPIRAQHKSGSELIQLPVQIKSNGQVRVQATINERGHVFLLLDSGSCHSLLNVELVKPLRLKTWKFDSKSLPCGLFESTAKPSLTVNGKLIPDQEFVLGAMGRLFPDQPVDYDGTFGHDLFNRYVVKVDYDGSTIILYDRRQYSYTGPGKRLTIHIEKLLPVISVDLRRSDGQLVKGNFVLDTAAECDVCSTERFLKENRLMDSNNLFPAIAETYVGDIKVTTGNVNATADRQLAGTKFDGIVGALFLRDYNLILDYPHNQLILESRSKR
jgi:hypothetical protein